MVERNALFQLLGGIDSYVVTVSQDMQKATDTDEVQNRIVGLNNLIAKLSTVIPETIYEKYDEFFGCLMNICKDCIDEKVLASKYEEIYESLLLFLECLDEIKNEFLNSVHICPCCGTEVIYQISDDKSETICPKCKSNANDRMITTIMTKLHVQEAKEGFSVLLVEPTPILNQWFAINSPQIQYDVIVGDNRKTDNDYDLILFCDKYTEYRIDESMLKRLRHDGILIMNSHLNMTELGVKKPIDDSFFSKEEIDNINYGSPMKMFFWTKDVKQSFDLKHNYTINPQICESGPLVSVILPCYNHEKYVARAIESVINQTYKNIEFLVVDDGSTDHTPDIMKQYAKYFTKAWYFDDNKTYRIDFLAGFAKGKYIALMHSDDVWDSNKIALQVQYMEEHKECGVCLTWGKMVDDQGNEGPQNVFIQPNRSRKEWMEYFWLKGNCLCNPSSLTRTDIFQNHQKHGLSCRQLPDYFKWIDTVRDYDIHIIPTVLTRMGWHPTGENNNTSAPSVNNSYRHIIEDAINWLYVVEDMSIDEFIFFFGELFVDKEADTAEQIMCEKYFLLLHSDKLMRQQSAISYYAKHYVEMCECMKEHYKYTLKDFHNDEISKGFGQFRNDLMC